MGSFREKLESKRPSQCGCVGQARVICELTTAVEQNRLSETVASGIYDVNNEPDCQGMINSELRPGECQPELVCGHSLGKDHLGMLAVRVSGHPRAQLE